MSIIKDFRGALRGLASLSELRNSLENPEIPITSPEAVSYFDGASSSTGVRVNENTAMGVASILAGVKVLTESVGSLSLETYKRLEGGGRSRAVNHPTYSMLKLRPNPFMSGINYRELAMKQLIFRGNHFAEIEFDNNGYPKALWPLIPENTSIIHTGRHSMVYVTTINNQRVGIPGYRVLHISALGDGINGKGLLDYSRETIGYASALDQWGGKFFLNGAAPSGFLKHPGKLSTDARAKLKTAWNMSHGGLSNAHRVAVFEEGIDWVKTSVSPEEAQAIESKKFTRSEIAGILRVPAHFINDLEKATFSNIEHLNISFTVHSLRPWLIRFEQEMNYKLFAGEPDIFVEFNVDSLLRGDKKSRAEALEIERRNGVITPNEWRQIENKNPIENEYGDSYIVQLNNAMIMKDGSFMQMSGPTETNNSGTSREIAIEFLRETVKRVARREMKSVEEYLKSTEAQALTRDEATRNYYQSATWIDEILMPVNRALSLAGLKLQTGSYQKRSEKLLIDTGSEKWEERRIQIEIDSIEEIVK